MYVYRSSRLLVQRRRFVPYHYDTASPVGQQQQQTAARDRKEDQNRATRTIFKI